MTTDDRILRPDPKQVGDERFVHGLLEFMHRDGRGAQDARVQRVMASLPDTAPVVRRPAPRWRLSRLASMGGLATAMIGIALILGLPTEQSAHALVQSALVASKDAGARRYEIRVQLPGADAPRETPIGELDVSGIQVVIRMRTPEGHMLVVGRDDAGEWAIRGDGTIERYDAKRAWPRWIDLGDGTLLVESVDGLLAELAGGYALERADEGPAVAGLEGFTHIVARRTGRARRESGPESIEIWIDPATVVVARMDLIWDSSNTRRDGARPPGPERGPSGRERPDGRPGEGRPHAGPPPRPGDGRPPRGDPRPPRGERRPHGFIDGPPRFRDGHHPPPPRRIIFTKVDAPDFGADWFRPETHVEE